MKAKYLRSSFTYNGKRYEVYATNEKELESKKIDRLARLKAGEVVIESSMTLKKWSEICIDTYKVNMKDYVLDNYKARMKYTVLNFLGDLQLKNIKAINCQNCINEQSGKSKYQIDQTAQMMNFLFNKAVDNGLISKNPAQNIIKPKGTYTPRRSLTEYEQEIFIKACYNDYYCLFWLFMFACGCRPSEASNIKYNDIVLKSNKPFLHIRGTKTKNADRYVPIPEYLYKLILDQSCNNPFDLINKTSNNTKISPDRQRHAFKSLIRQMNILAGCRTYRNQLIPPYPISDALTTYCLRHTYCTNLQKQGVDIRTAQYLMGHSDIRMTANIYTHTTDELLIQQFDQITNIKFKA